MTVTGSTRPDPLQDRTTITTRGTIRTVTTAVQDVHSFVEHHQLLRDLGARRRQARQNAANGTRRGQQKREAAEALRSEIKRKAEAYRDEHEYHAHRANKKMLIAWLATEVNAQPDTILKHLNKLGLR